MDTEQLLTGQQEQNTYEQTHTLLPGQRTPTQEEQAILEEHETHSAHTNTSDSEMREQQHTDPNKRKSKLDSATEDKKEPPSKTGQTPPAKKRSPSGK
eukprot:858721-Rhodomonas_salina.1